MIRTVLSAALLFSTASGALAMDHHQSPPVVDTAGERVGTEHMVFETGVEGEAHEQFLRGLALLHNFEYSRARAAFLKAQAADPDWVMPYWGEAMTHNHPLWEYQDRQAGLAALAKLGEASEDRFAKVRTRKEQAWLSAAHVLFVPDETKEQRDRAYAEVMRAFLTIWPEDIDMRAFAGLSVLGTSHGGRDIAIYMQAAGVLEPGFMTHEQHPGILHYLIHSYDDPVHATLGERMAERYAKVAPDAGHAQHMVSHIYHALADWEASEKANVLAMAADNAARGYAYDCGHYAEWLVYALVQQGKDASANVEACRKQAGQELASKKRPRTSIAQRSAATSFARIAIYNGATSGKWPDGFDWPEDQFRRAQFHMANARLLQAREDAEAAREALAEMKRVQQDILAVLPSEYPDETGLQTWNARSIAQGEAIVTLALGESEAGLAALRAAAEAESALPVVFGPPVIAKPSWELLGEELLARGRSEEAAEAFEMALKFAPGRKLSIEGLASAKAN